MRTRVLFSRSGIALRHLVPVVGPAGPWRSEPRGAVPATAEEAREEPTSRALYR
jgi:hypothetical protein